MPALPLDEAGRYVAAAYIVFVALLIVYVAIMAVRLGHLSREIESLAELAERRERERHGDDADATSPAPKAAAPGDLTDPAEAEPPGGIPRE